MSIYVSLLKVQERVKNPKKDTKGFGYKYATLDQVIDIIKPELLKENIVLIQSPYSKEGRVGILTILKSTYEIPENKSELIFEFDVEMDKKRDIQAIGSYITYLRRYSLLSIFNLAPEDDDGVSALEKNDVAPKIETKQILTKSNPQINAMRARINNSKGEIK